MRKAINCKYKRVVIKRSDFCCVELLLPLIAEVHRIKLMKLFRMLFGVINGAARKHARPPGPTVRVVGATTTPTPSPLKARFNALMGRLARSDDGDVITMLSEKADRLILITKSTTYGSVFVARDAHLMRTRYLLVGRS